MGRVAQPPELVTRVIRIFYLNGDFAIIPVRYNYRGWYLPQKYEYLRTENILGLIKSLYVLEGEDLRTISSSALENLL